ncbi:FkbM family methyltransferase [Rubricella aquisinus]|uniref:FkbM family methyltransferase n=1 Tax=Rubricella aquisinus TaxID=2028108 RepID=UPI00160FBE79|nr:FkbM family methyltransferase [Rubricella aquisinus]
MRRTPYHNRLLPLLQRTEARLIEQIRATPEGRQRGMLLDDKWHIAKMMGAFPAYASQSGQDHYLDKAIFRGKRDGVFVDIGAFDGVAGSNTLHFEAFKGWTGLLVEPSPKHAAQCRENRSVPTIGAAISGRDGTEAFLEIQDGLEMMGGLMSTLDRNMVRAFETGRLGQSRVVPVDTMRLDTLLRAHDLHRVDYLSLDIEGGEWEALRDFPFDAFDVHALSIEMNLNARDLRALMARHGYHRVACIGVDEIFVKADRT